MVGKVSVGFRMLGGSNGSRLVAISASAESPRRPLTRALVKTVSRIWTPAPSGAVVI